MKVVHKNFQHVLPPAPGLCQVCGGKHPPELPHNMTSLYYQVSFHQKNGRYPTWEDAMAHCTEKMKAHAREVIAEVMAEEGLSEAEATLEEGDIEIKDSKQKRNQYVRRSK